MKVSSFDIKGALVIVPSFLAPFSAFATQSFSYKLLIGILIASITSGLSAWRGYLSMPPVTADTTKTTTIEATPGSSEQTTLDTTK